MTEDSEYLDVEAKEFTVVQQEERLTDDDLIEEDVFVVGAYFDMLDDLYGDGPQLANTDGEELLPHQLYFKIVSAGEAFRSLVDLAAGEPTASLMAEAVLDESGEVSQVEIPWLRRDAKADVLLGRIMIDGTKLLAEVNSKERRPLQVRNRAALAVGNLSHNRHTTCRKPAQRRKWQPVDPRWGSAAGSESGDGPIHEEPLGQLV